ncbi:hypothetical protein W97_00550 [Coniosporium apollinis CBS 100218]|uniref:Dihydrolipoamide acetyltransferase component of pyruvate dehydrogenase complex n=1 Tax=Coniosporium apollinis (strain CBS 100218) TaxID=1168221 RepID=R7YHF2_CONA1|nr:uncharacterized protein W97_00550 [Coniosporium apollinis CBS 100218]EON61337.1 hypothetical protein W97_00550 [Coniosporium apollinis CBS 100218]
MKTLIIRELGCILKPSVRPLCGVRPFKSPATPRQHPRRPFHGTARRNVVKPYLLADIGEGITECQVIQWFVQPGARVEQFDKICEVQSDKASVEITSRFDGVIKKLYYEADDMAKVGKPLVDIDIQGDIAPEDEALTKVSSEQPKQAPEPEQPRTAQETSQSPPEPERDAAKPVQQSQKPRNEPSGKHATLATPAVRHLTKELDLDIADITGTGKDGRVLKEDVQKHASSLKEAPALSPAATTEPHAEDKTIPLTPIQVGMYKAMTRSLSIPHFLYTDNVDFTSLNTVRRKLNLSHSANSAAPTQKLSSLPFIVKAVSLALQSHPILNAAFEPPRSPSEKPQLTLKASHNIGIAIDTPSGLLVPVVRAVQNHSIASLAAEIARLAGLARAGKLSTADLSGATFTVSNIGSIGGTAVAPVIVSPQVAILGVGRTRTVPAFGETGELVRREECVFSWSADHRVVDGAMVARCAESVRRYLEKVEGMLVRMR